MQVSGRRSFVRSLLLSLERIKVWKLFLIDRHKILPQLITAYEYGDAGSAILPPMFKVRILAKEFFFCHSC